MGDLGLFGLVVPEEFGGADADFTSLCVAIEELGRVDQSVGITLSAGVGLGINPILTFGTADQKARWSPDLVVGLAQACLDACLEYAGMRQAFQRPIGVNQGISFPIADLAVAVEAARLLTYKAAWLRDEQAAGRRGTAEVKQSAAIAKLHSSTAAVDATRLATQVFGGAGFIEEYPVARFYRDAKILEIGEGTSEV